MITNRDLEKTHIMIKEMERRVSKPRKTTKVNLVFNELAALEVGEDVCKVFIVMTHWGGYDYFKERSFDVAYFNARKLLPERKFKTAGGIITRIE